MNAQKPLTVISAKNKNKWIDLHEIWRYRELLWALAARDMKVRYKHTLLGCAWALVQPFVTMVFISVIFGKLAKLPSDGYPYPAFVYAALLPWNFFSSAAGAAAGSIINSANLITKVYFPRIIVPISSVLVGLVDFFVALSMMFLLMAYYKIWPGAALLALPLFIAMAMITAIGVGAYLCALVLPYRDFRFIIPFVLSSWMYLTPLVYPLSLIPQKWRWAAFLNPMTGVVEGFRFVFLGKSLDVSAFLLSLAISILIFFAGLRRFAKAERTFADIV